MNWRHYARLFLCNLVIAFQACRLLLSLVLLLGKDQLLAQRKQLQTAVYRLVCQQSTQYMVQLYGALLVYQGLYSVAALEVFACSLCGCLQ